MALSAVGDIPVLLPVDILRVVSALASIGAQGIETALSVHLHGDNFEVVGAYAQRHSAEMVDYEAVRNGAALQFVRDAMRIEHPGALASGPDDPVAHGVRGGGPYPAPATLADVLPESICDRRSSRRH